MRTLSFALLACVLLGTAAEGAAAQQVPSPYRYVERQQEIGFFLGYVATERGIQVDTTDVGEVPFGPESAPLFGVRYAYRLGGPISVGASIGYLPSQRRVFFNRGLSGDTNAVVLGDTADTDANLLLAQGELLLHLTGDRTYRGFAPFVGVAAGIATELGDAGPAEREIPEDQRFDFGPSFALAGALGTDYFVTERVSLRAEVRDQLWRIEVPEGLRTDDDADDARYTQNFTVQVGLAYHF